MHNSTNFGLNLPETSDWADISKLNENFQTLDGALLRAVSTAAEYSASGIYAAGAFCTHGAKLYKCSTAITSAEAWTAAHWTETTVFAELSAISCETPLKNDAAKAAPADADRIPVIDSADNSATKLTTWAQIKSALKTINDLLYAAKTHAAQHHTEGADPIAPGDIGAAKTPTKITVSLPASGWVKNAASNCYEQTAAAAGLLTTDGPQNLTIDHVGSTDAAAQLLTDEAYSAIFTAGGYAACTTADQLYCRGPAGGDAPGVDFSIYVIVTR